MARCEGQGMADDVRALRTPSTAPSISRGQHRKTLDFGASSTSGPDRAVDMRESLMVEDAVTAS